MFQELINEIDKLRIEEYPEEKASIVVLKEYFQKFFPKYASKKVDVLKEITQEEVLESLILVSNPSNAALVLELLKKHSTILNNKNYYQIITGFIYYYNNREFKEVIDSYLHKGFLDKLKASYQLGYTCKSLDLLNNTGVIFLKFLKRYPEILDELELIFKSFSLSVLDLAHRFLKSCADFNDLSANDIHKNIYDALTKKYKKIGSSVLLKQHNSNVQSFTIAINEFINFLNNEYNKALKNYDKETKQRRKQNNNLTKLKELLNTDEEIKDIEAILKLCPNDEIKVKVLDYIIFHNKPIHEALVKEYNDAKEKSDSNLTELFRKYGFDYNMLSNTEVTELKNLAYDTILDTLKRVNKLGLAGINIGKIDLKRLAPIEELITKGAINKSWLLENYEILERDNNDLSIILDNITNLSKNGVNIINYQNSLDILRSTRVNFNLALLKIYGLNISRATTNINFLSKKNLQDIIEFIISLGLYSNLKSLDILNYNIKDCLCLKIANYLSIPFSEVVYSDELICDLCPSIIPNDIKEILDLDCNFIMSSRKTLKEYYYDNETLRINGVFVSSKKLERNIGKLGRDDKEACFYAIIYNGFYTYEEIKALSMELLPERDFSSLVRR